MYSVVILTYILAIANVFAVEHMKSYLISNISAFSVTMAFDETFIYTTSSNDVVQKDFQTGNIVRTLRGPNTQVIGLALLNDTLISGHVDGVIYQWNLTSGAILKWFQVEGQCSMCQLLLFESNLLICCSFSQSLMVELNTGKVMIQYDQNQYFYVYNDMFYAFNGYNIHGLFGYQKNFTKTYINPSSFSAIARNDVSIFAADLHSYKVGEISSTNGAFDVFSGAAHSSIVVNLVVVESYLVSTGYDVLVLVWDINRKGQMKTLSCHYNQVDKLYFYNSSSIFLVDVSGPVILCDVLTDTKLKVFTGARIDLSGLAIVGDTIFAGGISSGIQQWSISSREQLAPLPNNSFKAPKVLVTSNLLLSCAFSIVIRDLYTKIITKILGIEEVHCDGFYYDSGFVYASSIRRGVSKYNLTEEQLVLYFHSSQITSDCTGLTILDSYLYASFAQNFLFVWNANNGIFFAIFPVDVVVQFAVYKGKVVFGNQDQVQTIDIATSKLTSIYSVSSPVLVSIYDSSSEYLFVAGVSTIIYALDSQSGFQQGFQFLGHSGTIANLQISGNFLFSCSDDGTIKQWSISTKRLAYSFEDRSFFVLSLVSYSNNLVFGTQGGTIYNFEISSAYVKTYVAESIAAVSDIIFANGLVFSSSLDGKITVYNATILERIHSLDTTVLPNSLYFNEGFLYSGNSDSTVIQWNYTSGRNLRTFYISNEEISDLLFKDEFLLAACDDSYVYLVKIQVNKVIMKYGGHSGSVTSIVLSEDILYSASTDKTILAFDYGSGDIIKQYKRTINVPGHLGPVNQIIICNGNLFSASSDLTIKQWDIATGAVLYTLFGHMKAVTCLDCFGYNILSGSNDGSVYLWKPIFSLRTMSSVTDMKGTKSLFSSNDNNFASSLSLNLIYIFVGIAVFLLFVCVLIALLSKNIIRKTVNITDQAKTPDSSVTDTATLFTQVLGIAIPGYLEFNNTSFRLLNQIAKGGGGAIWLAEVFGKRENIISKVLSTNYESLSSSMKLAFDQEVTLMEFLKSHRNIAKIVGFCRIPCCILMKYYEKGSLMALIMSDGNLSKIIVTNCLNDICKGIQFMHSKAITHGDLKPDNVLIDSDEKGLFFVLTDFGIAKINNSKYLATNSFQIANLRGLSVHYAAPEAFVMFRKKITFLDRSNVEASDIYSLGVMMYVLCTRKAPWH